MEDFYLYIQFQSKKQKVKLVNPNTNISVLIGNLRQLKDAEGKYIFNMPKMGEDGVPMDYLFGKIDETGHVLLLHSNRGKTEYCLLDYNIKSGDTIELITDPKAG